MSNNSYYNDQWRIINEKNQSLVSNYSMNFDGSSDFIDCGDNFSFGNGATDSPFSISAWINMDSTSTFRILSKWDSSLPNYEYAWGTGGGNKLQFIMYDGTNQTSGYRLIVMDTILNTGQWYHTMVTYDGRGGNDAEDGVKIYVDGALVSVTITVVGTYTAMNDLSLNAYIGANGTVSYANGKIDQVSIFDYALPATGTNSVATLYGGGTAITNPLSLSPKPISYYQLGDQSVSTGANLLVPNNSLSDYVFSFDGSSSEIDLGTSVILNSSSAFSFSSWVNLENYTNYAYPYIVKLKTPSTNGWRIMLSQSSGYEGITIGNSGTFAQVRTSGNISQDFLNSWNHIAVTYNGSGSNTISNWKIYVNGSSVSVTPSGVIGSDTNTSFIGSGDGQRFFIGKISNVSIFNTELTSTQVETIYNNGAPNDISSLSPTAWYKLNAADTFDGNDWTINNYGSGGNDGTSVGMTSSNLVVSDLQQTSGYSPYALDFDGVNDYLDCGTTTNYDTGDLSVAIWVNASSSRTGTVYAFSNSGSPSFAGFDFVINTSNQIRIRRSTMTKSNETSFLTTGFSSDTWQHLAFTYNESTNTIKVFLNAVLQDTSIGFTQTNTASKKLTIGSYKGTGNFFNGELSNAVIWNTELTSTQVTEIYNEGRPSDLHSFSTAPVAWWQLGSNSSFNTNWTCLNEGSVTGSNAVSAGGMTNDDITDGPGYSASGLGTSSIEIIGDAPYSTANGLSENQDVLARVKDTPPT